MNIALNRLPGKFKARVNTYFFSNAYDGLPLAILRVGLGLILLSQFVQLLPDITTLLGTTGFFRQDIQNIEVPPYILKLSTIVSFFAQTIGFKESATLLILGIVYVTSIVTLTLGLFTRFSACICWLLHLTFVSSAHLFTYGVDYFLTILLFYSVIFPLGKTFALDCFIFSKKEVTYTPFVRLLQINIAVVYLISGLSKAAGANWWNGVSVWKAINRPNTTSYNIHALATFDTLYTVLGIGTVIVEVFYILFINIEKTRKLWLWLTCAMHLCIAFVLHLPYFAAVMILFNVSAYYCPRKTIPSPKI